MAAANDVIWSRGGAVDSRSQAMSIMMVNTVFIASNN